MSDPIRIGHRDTPIEAPNCGACAGTALSTVQPIDNRPDLSAIVYRAGTHAQFKASMLTALASADHDVLAQLGTRDDDDFSIALIDAWAAACDVLSFYQERHANEAYIQTATERFSIGEIARLTGYRLHPGSAAETDLVFSMDNPPGAEPDVADLLIPVGTAVQSQPGPDETAQVFETLEDLDARVAWNALHARQSRRLVPVKGDTGTWLDGQATGLTAGDTVLIVGRERGDPAAPGHDPGSELWDFRRIVAAEPSAELDRTWVEWSEGIGSIVPPGEPAQADHRFYVFSERASLFGYNAPHPLVLSKAQRDAFGYVDDEIDEFAGEGGAGVPSPSLITGTDGNPGDWAFDLVSNQLSLDSVYKGFVDGSWVALTLPNGYVELYNIVKAVEDGESRYGISGKVTRLTLDTTEGLTSFEAQYRRVGVHGASVELAMADTPITTWVSGSTIELDGLVDELPEGRRLIVTGRRAQVQVVVDGFVITDAEGAARAIPKGTRLTLRGEPLPVVAPAGHVLWQLTDADGFSGSAEAATTDLLAVPADDTAEVVAEKAELSRVDPADPSHSIIVLADALDAAYDRADVSIHANVVPSSHGEGATEILGGGDPSQPFQRFLLKQNPVTHRLAGTETGVDSTLEVRVDGVRWDEQPDLYARPPTGRLFTTILTDEGETIIQFGDGHSGARPTPGRDNIVAEYRKGLGVAGNVRSGQLSLPLERPLGLREVVNPLPASGGADAEAADAARRNAPIYTLTLGRLVSITDYRDFALGYPGIDKAEAHWVWDGETRRIVVTVAGADGVPIDPDGPLHEALLDSYRDLGDPFVQFTLISYSPSHFRLGLKVAVDAAHETDVVLAATEATIRDAFAFTERGFAEPVALSRVAAVAHETPGVVAVDIDRLYRDDGPQTAPIAHSLLQARPGRLDAGVLMAAEILTLAAEPFESLEVLS